MRRQRILWVLKLCTGITLLSLLLFTADLREVADQFRTVDPGWLVAMLIVPHLGILLSTIKWHALLRCQGSSVGMGVLLRLYLVGTFFNNFLPTMIGGDIVRAQQLRHSEPRTHLVIASTFLERFIGFGGLISLLPLACLHPVLREELPAAGYAALLAMAAYTAVTVLLVSPIALLPSFDPRVRLLRRVLDALRKAQRQVWSYREHRGVLVWSYVLSLVFYVAAALTVWLGTRAVGASVSIAFLLAATPVVLLAATVPISVNGLGILESGYVLVLTLVSVPIEQAATVALLLRVRILLTAILGGVLFILLRNRRSSPDEAAAPTLAETPHARDAS